VVGHDFSLYWMLGGHQQIAEGFGKGPEVHETRCGEGAILGDQVVRMVMWRSILVMWSSILRSSTNNLGSLKRGTLVVVLAKK
jgi:hypothetical protein